MRCDACVVAVLAAVGDGDGEGAPSQRLTVDDQLVLGRFVPEELAQTDLDVGTEAAYVAGREAVGDECVEPEAHAAEEWDAVYGRRIDGDDASLPAGAEAGFGIHREVDVPREAVARADGEDAEGKGAPDEALADLMDRSVAADGIDDV